MIMFENHRCIFLSKEMIEKKKKSFCLLLVDCFLQFFVIVLDELLRIHSMSY